MMHPRILASLASSLAWLGMAASPLVVGAVAMEAVAAVGEEEGAESLTVDPLAGLRLSLAGQASLGLAAEKRALEDSLVNEAERAAVKQDGVGSKLDWKPTYEHLGRWGAETRNQAALDGIHCVLVVQSVAIKKGGKITTTFRPIGGGNSRPVKYQGAQVTMKFRVEVFDPHDGRWESVARWSLERDRTAVPAAVNLSSAKNGLVEIDAAELIADMLESEMRAHANTALRASVSLPENRPSNWVLHLTPNEERELWRRLAAIRFGRWSYRLSVQAPLPSREFGEQALARLEDPESPNKTQGLRTRAAKFLRSLLAHYREGAKAAWPDSLLIPSTRDAAGFRAAFNAGLASLDSPEGIRFDPLREGPKQSGGPFPFDLVIHEEALGKGLISSLPYAGTLRGYLVSVSDADVAAAPAEWKHALKNLSGAAIIERKRGKLVRSAHLAPRDVTSDALARLLLEQLSQ